jgi:hypothetical protein
VGGTCTCPAGTSNCSGTCVNLSTTSLDCGACGTACAANQVCSGGACINLTLGNGGVGGSLTGSSPPKVAILSTRGYADLKSKLDALAVFSSVTTHDISSSSSLPSLATMKTYDAVLVYTYSGISGGSAAFGDNLASYFEAGGGVVLADYETQESGCTSWCLTGRYETQYTLSTPVSSFLTNAVTLGTILEPASPLLTGVTAFGYSGSSANHMPASAFNRNSPVIVANYSDGTPAIVRGVIGGRNVVEINGDGVSSTYSSSAGWSGNGDRVFANALLYTIPPPALTVAKQLDLGAQTVYTQTAPQALTFTNVGTADQILTAISLSGNNIGDFAAVPSAGLPATIPPGGTFVVNVSFAPSGLGLRAAKLSATFQGYAGPATTLLTGTGQ